LLRDLVHHRPRARLSSHGEHWALHLNNSARWRVEEHDMEDLVTSSIFPS
jgi:hypothetical protein